MAFIKVSTLNHCKWNCRSRQGPGACWDHAGFILFYAGSSLGLSSIILLVLFKCHPISRRSPVPHHLSWRFCIKLHFQLRSNSHRDLARLVPDRRGSLWTADNAHSSSSELLGGSSSGLAQKETSWLIFTHKHVSFFRSSCQILLLESILQGEKKQQTSKTLQQSRQTCCTRIWQKGEQIGTPWRVTHYQQIVLSDDCFITTHPALPSVCRLAQKLTARGWQKRKIRQTTLPLASSPRIVSRTV